MAIEQIEALVPATKPFDQFNPGDYCQEQATSNVYLIMAPQAGSPFNAVAVDSGTQTTLSNANTLKPLTVKTEAVLAYVPA